MATFTESRIRERALASTGSLKKAATVLKEEVTAAKLKSRFDIFLSHSTSDAEIVLGVKGILEDYGRTVYVDWLHDPQLDRTHVTAYTAAIIRLRMQQSKSLVYVHTENTGSSKWMPWELGYFDGFNGAVSIFPVTETRQQDFKGQEYLGIYPYLDEAPSKGESAQRIWVNKDAASRSWSAWVSDPRSFEVAA